MRSRYTGPAAMSSRFIRPGVKCHDNAGIAMKSAELSFQSTFPWTPVSGRAGARMYGCIREKTPGGQLRRPRWIAHPFLEQRKQWCLLSIHFNGIDLRFAMPEELDHFVDVMSRNPLPSGGSLVPAHAIGRPKNHWLARLPKEAKSWKYRQALCNYLSDNKTVKEFRAYYKDRPVVFEFDGVFDSYLDAKWSHTKTRATV
jgi:hypothetical protein